LHAAALRAVKGKRKKPGAASFFANLERELLVLERQLREGKYRPGRYVAFEVNDPKKKRIVSAAPFRDRVVHHALCAVVEPIFDAGFIANTFANRVGKGTHRAIAAYERYRNCHGYVLRCDIFRYFPAIDHAILKADFRRRIGARRHSRCSTSSSMPRTHKNQSTSISTVMIYSRRSSVAAGCQLAI
jgi:retron-type reverse transcriptase